MHAAALLWGGFGSAAAIATAAAAAAAAAAAGGGGALTNDDADGGAEWGAGDDFGGGDEGDNGGDEGDDSVGVPLPPFFVVAQGFAELATSQVPDAEVAAALAQGAQVLREDARFATMGQLLHALFCELERGS